MLHITNAPGGLLISRWDGEGTPAPLEQLYVSQDELADVIARLIQEAGELDDASAWDVQAWPQGNPMTAEAPA